MKYFIICSYVKYLPMPSAWPWIQVSKRDNIIGSRINSTGRNTINAILTMKSNKAEKKETQNIKLKQIHSRIIYWSFFTLTSFLIPYEVTFPNSSTIYLTLQVCNDKNLFQHSIGKQIKIRYCKCNHKIKWIKLT